MENSSERWEKTAGGVGGFWADRGRNRLSRRAEFDGELANGGVGGGAEQGLGDVMVRLFVVRCRPLQYVPRVTGSRFSGV